MALRSQTHRTLLLCFIASIVLCGVVGIYCLILGTFGQLQLRVLATTATVGAAAILALASAIPWEQRRWPPLGLCGLIAVSIALSIVLIGIWFEPSWQHEWFYKMMGICCVAAVGFPHVGLLSLARLRRQYEWTRLGTVAVIALLALQIAASIIFEVDSELWFRLMGVLGILDACGTVAVPVLHRISGIRVEEDAYVVAQTANISLTCPRCHKSQTLPLGHSQCPDCRLKFSIEIEEEHCRKCGFLLYKVESGVCPECGTAILEQTVSEPVTGQAKTLVVEKSTPQTNTGFED